jgi:glycosyltransferase involved in cell wall biosynthesis
VRFKIVTATWNAEPWIERCLDSLASQEGQEFDVFVVVDPSDDDTAAIAEAYCERKGWGFRANNERRYALRNQVEAIRAMDDGDPDDVIVFVDGDDYLPHGRVLNRLAYHYRDGALLTYGQYRSEPFSPTCAPATPFPRDVIERGNYRRFVAQGGGIRFNHLRTFRYRVFNALDESDFLDDKGRWFTTVPDSALMIPCLELAGARHKCLQEELLVYNSENNQSEWRIRPRLIDADNDCILRKPVKAPLP